MAAVPGTVLQTALQRVARKQLCLHLPTHGQGRGLPQNLRRLVPAALARLDLPELPAVGGPLLETGAVADAQAAIARLWGSRACRFGVNGATGLLQAAVLGALRPGQRLLCPRSVHRSVLHAAVLAGIEPVYYNLPFDARLGLCRPPDVPWFEAVLKTLASQGPAVDLVLLVSPVYQGLSAPLAALVALCHRANLPVLVDEAHGSHFRAHAGLPRDALAAGADLVVHSAHKSLPGLTQTAVLHWQGNRFNREDLNRGLLLVQTSSPSALLLAATEVAAAWPHQPEAEQLLARALQRAQIWRQRLQQDGWTVGHSDDPLRLRLCTLPLGVSGLELDDLLLNAGLAAELPEPAGLTCCPGLCPPPSALGKLRRALHAARAHIASRSTNGAVFRALQDSENREAAPFPLVGRSVVSPRHAWFGCRCRIPLHQAHGRVVAEAVTPYPPGIPLVLPGEQLNREQCAWLARQQRHWRQPHLDTVTVLA